MIDIKSKLVLKILSKECPNGGYGIVETKDIISALPAKYRVEPEGLQHILIYLERQEYISIKYDDDGVYCLCVLPFGNEIIEKNNEKQKSEGKIPHLWLVFILAFLGSVCGSLIVSMIQNLG